MRSGLENAEGVCVLHLGVVRKDFGVGLNCFGVGKITFGVGAKASE